MSCRPVVVGDVLDGSFTLAQWAGDEVMKSVFGCRGSFGTLDRSPLLSDGQDSNTERPKCPIDHAAWAGILVDNAKPIFQCRRKSIVTDLESSMKGPGTLFLADRACP